MTTTARLSELTGDYVLDTARTRIGFVARHTMATKVRGQFDEFEGSAHLDGEDPSKSSVEVTIQAASIQTRNQQRDEAPARQVPGRANHPTITFTSTKVEQVDETNFTVTGDLTIRGVTKPVTVDFELTSAEKDAWGRHRVGFEGSVTINRRDWVVPGTPRRRAAVRLVSEKVTLEFAVAALRVS